MAPPDLASSNFVGFFPWLIGFWLPFLFFVCSSVQSSQNKKAFSLKRLKCFPAAKNCVMIEEDGEERKPWKGGNQKYHVVHLQLLKRYRFCAYHFACILYIKCVLLSMSVCLSKCQCQSNWIGKISVSRFAYLSHSPPTTNITVTALYCVLILCMANRTTIPADTVKPTFTAVTSHHQHHRHQHHLA